MAPAHRRGRMVTINELMIVTGQFLAFAMNAMLDARDQGPARVAVDARPSPSIPAVALFVGMFFLPDSPRWYAVRGRLDDTRRVLNLSRDAGRGGRGVQHHRRAREAGRRPRTRAPRCATCGPTPGCAGSCGSAAAWPRCSRPPASTRSTTTRRRSWSPPASGPARRSILTITVGVVAIIGTILGIVLLGYFNRRPLLLTGFTGVAAGTWSWRCRSCCRSRRSAAT